jgi:hypothetical protein
MSKRPKAKPKVLIERDCDSMQIRKIDNEFYLIWFKSIYVFPLYPPDFESNKVICAKDTKEGIIEVACPRTIRRSNAIFNQIIKYNVKPMDINFYLEIRKFNDPTFEEYLAAREEAQQCDIL